MTMKKQQELVFAETINGDEVDLLSCPCSLRCLNNICFL